MNDETPTPPQSNAAPVNPVPPAPGPAAGAPTPPPAPAAPAPTEGAKPGLRLASKPMGASAPLSNQQIERAVKLPGYAKQFSSPMPKLDESSEETPGWMAGLSALAAVVAVASAVLLFLKN